MKIRWQYVLCYIKLKLTVRHNACYTIKWASLGPRILRFWIANAVFFKTLYSFATTASEFQVSPHTKVLPIVYLAGLANVSNPLRWGLEPTRAFAFSSRVYRLNHTATRERHCQEMQTKFLGLQPICGSKQCLSTNEIAVSAEVPP